MTTLAAQIEELRELHHEYRHNGGGLDDRKLDVVMDALPDLLSRLQALEAVAEAAKETLNGVSCLCAEGVEFMGRVALADAILKDLKPLQAALDNLNALGGK